LLQLNLLIVRLVGAMWLARGHQGSLRV